MDEQRIFLALDAELGDLKVKHAAALASFQDACPHERVLETPMRDGWGMTNAPMRVCVTCGWAENGWGCGYGMLGGQEWPRVSRERFNELRRGPIHQWAPGKPHRNDRQKAVK